MQRGGHVDALVVVVGALEADVLRAEVRADPIQEVRKRNTAPSSDRTPAFDADVARNLLLLRKRRQLLERPGPRLAHAPAHEQSKAGGVHARHPFDLVVRVERKGARDHRFRIGRRKTVRVEQPALHPIVEARNPHQQRFGRLGVRHVAAGQHRQTAERDAATQESAPGLLLAARQVRGHVTGAGPEQPAAGRRPSATRVDRAMSGRLQAAVLAVASSRNPLAADQRPKIIVFSVRGTSATIAT